MNGIAVSASMVHPRQRVHAEFLVYNDAINSIVRMAVTFGDEVGTSKARPSGRSSWQAPEQVRASDGHT